MSGSLVGCVLVSYISSAAPMWAKIGWVWRFTPSMCDLQLRFLSNVSPRYLIVLASMISAASNVMVSGSRDVILDSKSEEEDEEEEEKPTRTLRKGDNKLVNEQKRSKTKIIWTTVEFILTEADTGEETSWKATSPKRPSQLLIRPTPIELERSTEGTKRPPVQTSLSTATSSIYTTDSIPTTISSHSVHTAIPTISTNIHAGAQWRLVHAVTEQFE